MPTYSPVRVLIVDDHPDTAESAAMVLTLSGCPATFVQDPTLALPAVAEFRPDVVVVDLRMPKVDGATVAKMLLALPDRPKVVVVSGSQERERELRAVGVDGFLVKPADPVRLLEVIRGLVG